MGHQDFLQTMFGPQKVQRKKNVKEKQFSHIWFYYEKYKRKSNTIKIIQKLIHFKII